MTHPKLPFSLSVGPAKQTPVHGQAQVLVSDPGAKPLNIHTEVLQLSGAHCGHGLAQQVTVSPARFLLQPGHHLLTTVRIPSGLPAGDYGVLYLASAGGHTGVTLTGAVGSQILVRGAAVCHPVAAPLAPHVASGFPIVWLVVGLIALVLAVVGTGMYLRRRA